ncbi:MAG TPA: carboxypeptidase-like regulatory domain-containing protein [Phycisphaerae bacterium]|nr:carboxypeptidase-like regulatory domain-containing protein [Phycisphaerae bacterium]
MIHPHSLLAFLLPLALLPTANLAAPASRPATAPASQSAGQITGIVLDPRGKPAANYRVALHASPPLPKPLDALSDNTGHFTLASVPPGSYELTCVPDGARTPIATTDKLLITPAAPAQNLTLSFAAQFTITGKVALADGRPAAGWIVRATFVSPDGAIELDIDTPTDAQGRYSLAGPYKNVSFVDVISSPQPTPAKNLTAPAADINFKLLSAQEEMKRVR